MGTDVFSEKKKKDRLARKQDSKDTKRANAFLIVSEGTKTEPFYFDGLSNKIAEKFGNGILVEKPIIDTFGEGEGTSRLVNTAVRIAKDAHIMYEHQWVVFDKDDFTDFDEAIDLANRSGFNVAWSNQCFEFWLYLHFNFCDAALHRSEWVEKLNDIFKSKLNQRRPYKRNVS